MSSGSLPPSPQAFVAGDLELELEQRREPSGGNKPVRPPVLPGPAAGALVRGPARVLLDLSRDSRGAEEEVAPCVDAR
jgi:hypothetical protein